LRAASGDEITSIGKLLTGRWLHRRLPMKPFNAQADAEEALNDLSRSYQARHDGKRVSVLPEVV
jgi:hypothetical protein